MKKHLIMIVVIYMFVVLGGCSIPNDKYVGGSTTDNTFDNTSDDTSTIVGYSYYDEYGNYLADGKGIRNFKIYRQEGNLTKLEFDKSTHSFFDESVQIVYKNRKISQINVKTMYLNMEQYDINSVNSTSSDRYKIDITYNLEKTSILYEYYSDHFIQTQTKEYIIKENEDKQVILTKIEKDVFTKSIIDGKNKISYFKELIYSLGEDPKNLIQSNLLKLIKNNELVTDDIQNHMTTINNNENSFKYEIDVYAENDDSIIYNYNDQKEIIENKNEDNILDIKRIDHNTDFSDQPIEYLNTKYDGNVKIFEKINHYFWRPSSTKTFNYQPHYLDNGDIASIAQYENNQLVYRYVFERQDYGYKVIHNSYGDDPNVNNHLLNGLRSYGSPLTPMYIVRVESLYTNALLRQTIPYEYLLWP